MIFEIFPLEYTLLQQELMEGYHPGLAEILATVGPEDLDMKLAQIAAYCGVGLDGIYTLDDRRLLCIVLRRELFKRRKPLPTVYIN